MAESTAHELEARIARLETEVTAQRAAIEALRNQTQGDGNRAAWFPPQRQVLPERKPAAPSPPYANALVDPAAMPAQGPVPARHGVLFGQQMGAASSPVDTAAPARPARSLEDRIGAQLFQKVGIVALLIGVAAFLKYAMDNHWIHPTPTGRVVVGLLAGAGVVLWSERFRRKGYPAFSYALKAVGTGTLYLTLWTAFHLYHLLPAPLALLLMVGVTAWNAMMAWRQDAELLAAYAVTGAFATPALLGSGGNQEVFLFSYVLAVDVAVLWLLAKKPWQRLLFGAFPATVACFIIWYAQWFAAPEAGLTVAFAVLLAAPFAALAFVGLQRERVGEGVIAPLGAAMFLTAALYSVLEDSGRHGWLPWSAVALGAAYLLLARARRGSLSEAIHLSLSITLLTIAIPLKASGRWISIGWLAEGVALAWAASRGLDADAQPSVRGALRWLSVAALVLGLAGAGLHLVIDNAKHAVANARFLTEMFAVAALTATWWLAVRAKDEPPASVRAPAWPAIAAACVLTGHVLAIASVLREAAHFWGRSTSSSRDALATWTEAAVLLLYAVGVGAWRHRRGADSDGASSVPVKVAVAAFVCGYLVAFSALFQSGGDTRWRALSARFALEVVALVCIGAVAWFVSKHEREAATAGRWQNKIGAGCVLAFNFLAVCTGASEIAAHFARSAAAEPNFAKAVSISAWLMLYAAALLAAGFWTRSAFVRWQGLALLVFTIGKVFLYDMSSLSAGYRVLSFIGLGALLMAVSFAYQKDWLALREAPTQEPPRA